MISADALRPYHRQLCLYVMQRDEAQTASEIHEAMTATALAMSHPKECASITPAAVAGLLRAMQRDGAVEQGSDKPNPRYGRAEPTWRPAAGLQPIARPDAPPDDIAQPKRVAEQLRDPMAGLSREQLMAMLLVGDELAAATARFQAEVEQIKARARAMLASGTTL